MLLLRFIPLIAVLVLVGCNSLQTLERVQPKGDAFQTALSKEYLEFSRMEADLRDWIDSNHFAEKGLKAAYGNSPLPEEPEQWDIAKSQLATLQNARKQLLDVLSSQNKRNKPQLTARAQYLYDCWVEQQEENWQTEHIAACRDEFFQTLEYLQTGKKPRNWQKPKKKEEPKPAPATLPKTESNGVDLEEIEKSLKAVEKSYVVFFDYDSTLITQDAGRVIDDVYRELAQKDDYMLTLQGFTDSSGNMEYNQQLAYRRALAVKNALVKRGIPATQIKTVAVGEGNLMIETGDGVKERANRKVEIIIKE